MPYSKIIINDTVAIDLTQDDITAEDVLQGRQFHTSLGGVAIGKLIYPHNQYDIVRAICELPGQSVAFQLIDSSITTMRSYVFYYHSGITNLSLNKCSSIGSSAFCYCTGLKSAWLPALTNLWNSGFYNCSQLSQLYAPQLQYISAYGLASTRLNTLVLPQIKSVYTNAIRACPSLQMAKLGCNNANTSCSIGSFAFYGCELLESLCLKYPQVVTLQNSNAFTYTKLSRTNSGGYIYVPSNMVDAYLSTTATNWSPFSQKITQLETTINIGIENNENELVKILENVPAEYCMTWQEWVEEGLYSKWEHAEDNPFTFRIEQAEYTNGQKYDILVATDNSGQDYTLYLRYINGLEEVGWYICYLSAEAWGGAATQWHYVVSRGREGNTDADNTQFVFKPNV